MLISELMEQVNNGTLVREARPFADDSVFIERVHELERTYSMRWYEFMENLGHYERIATGVQRMDFAEWKILCDKFSDQLDEGLEGLTIMASPPIQEELFFNEGPRDRAFLFC